MVKEAHKCFVLMPFVDALREVYEEVYKPVCEANALVCWRVDEVSRPGSITRDIIEGILDAHIIIADLTTRNSNVFYELGIAHCTGNKTIMTAQKKEDVPFDIANYRVIFYEQSIKGSKELFAALDSAIKELVKALEQTNNPVQEAFSNRSLGGGRQRVPIFREISPTKLSKQVRSVLTGEGIAYADELRRLDPEAIKIRYGLGHAAFSQLVRLLYKYEAYEDVNKLNEIAMRYRLDTEEGNRGYRF